jgi:hypothetical protein
MIADHDQLELWRVREEVAPHEARGDRIAAGHLLDARFGPSAALFRLGCRHQSRAAEHREIGRVLVAIRDSEGFHRGCDGIVLQDRSDRVEKDRFTVAAGAIDEHQRMLARQIMVPRRPMSASWRSTMSNEIERPECYGTRTENVMRGVEVR